jgi:2-hydroxycyclohexanecarboxyl-CoA dehydrogenase
MKIKGTRAVVTGAGSGIGRATAIRLASRGAQVVCVDIDADSAAETAELCAGRASWRRCDVSDSAAVAALAAEIESVEGPVDILVNNAGVGVGGPFLETSIKDWDWLMGINLDGVAYGCHAFGGPMVERGRGHVVNIASGAAYIHSRHMAAYCASKSAVVTLSKCLRADWAGSGVGVSAICPGVINTGIHTRSRIYGRAAGRTAWIERAFQFGHSADVVARAIAGAVEHNRAVVPVGLESEVLYRVLPFVPGRLQQLAARAG